MGAKYDKKPSRKTTPSDWRRWQEKRDSGLTLREIAESEDVSETAIGAHTVQNLPPRSARTVTDSQIARMEALYAEGRTIGQISQSMHIRKGTIGTYIYKACRDGRLVRRLGNQKTAAGEKKEPPEGEDKNITVSTTDKYKTLEEAKAADDCNRNLRGLSLAEYNRLLKVNGEYDRAHGLAK